MSSTKTGHSKHRIVYFIQCSVFAFVQQYRKLVRFTPDLWVYLFRLGRILRKFFYYFQKIQ
jgi:hypothetical protein